MTIEDFSIKFKASLEHKMEFAYKEKRK